MASRYYGVNVGAMNPKDVTEAGSTNSVAVEVAIDLTKCTDKLQAVQALTALLNYIQTTETNPIA